MKGGNQMKIVYGRALKGEGHGRLLAACYFLILASHDVFFIPWSRRYIPSFYL